MTPGGVALLAFSAAFCAACTLQDQQPPPLIGPSESSTSISVTAAPDVLPTDGDSTAVVTVTARDAYGIAMRNLSLRAEIRLDHVAVSLGTLSAQNILTDGSGRATLLYTAPAIHGDADTGIAVQITLTPIGSNFANAISRSVSIRLVPSRP